MAYDERFADRIREHIHHLSVVEKKMMGGLCFMLNDKMFAGIIGDELMLRVDPSIYDKLLEKHGCHEMRFTGRALKGYVLVEQPALQKQDDLERWLQLAIDFNPLAKSSKKKAK